MVDPDKLDAFNTTLSAAKSSADNVANSNTAAVAARADLAAKAQQVSADLDHLQVQLDALVAAGIALGLKVNVPTV